MQRAEWETQFCVPFYRGGYRDTNTAYWAAHSVVAGPGEDLLGIYIVTPHAQWAGMNLAFISEPVFDLPNLKNRIARAAAFYREQNLGWTLVVCEDWIAPDLRGHLNGLCRELSFSHPLEALSMTGRIEPAPLPQNLEIRRVSTPAMRREFADINAEAWSVPLEWTREVLENDSLWSHRTEGYIGYVGEEAASVAMVYPVEEMSYISWSATRTPHRRRGYADALGRHLALRKVGGPESMVIASPMGAGLWSGMGFSTIAKFSLYVSGDRKD